MKKIVLFALLAVVFASPAVAHPHHEGDFQISAIAFFAYFFAGIACVMAMAWGGLCSRVFATLAFVGPIVWGLLMVWTGHGAWTYEHYAAHHNMASYLGLVLALVVFGMIDWRLTKKQVAKS